MEDSPEKAFTLKLPAGKNGDRFYLAVYKPMLSPVDKQAAFWIAGIPRSKLPKNIQNLFAPKEYVGFRSLRRPEVEADTLKLKALLSGYAPVHNLTKDRALAKCDLEIGATLYHVDVPYRFRTAGTVPWRLHLENIKVLKFPEAISAYL